MMAGNPAKTSRAVEARERERKALEFRKVGYSYAKIGAALGISDAAAFKAVTRALERLNKEIAEDVPEVRRLELERLDVMTAATLPRASTGDLEAIDRALRIMERRSKLMGLDAPAKSKQDIAVGAPGGGPIQFILPPPPAEVEEPEAQADQPQKEEEKDPDG